MQKIAMLILLCAFLVPISSQVSYQDLFSQWDDNHDGRIAMQEFPGDPVYFAEIDMNRDGAITISELQQYFNLDTPTTTQPQQADHRACEQKLARLQNELNQANAATQQYQNEIKKYTHFQNEMTQLNNEIAKKEQENQVQRRTIQELQNKIAQTPVANPSQVNQLLENISQLKQNIQLKDARIQNLENELREREARISNLEAKLTNSSIPVVAPTKPTTKPTAMLDEKAVPPVANILQAREYARVDAYDMLAKQISGHWIAASSKNIDGENQLKIVSKVPPTALFMVDVVDDGSDMTNGLIRIKAIIKRENAIESIRRTKEGNGQKLSYEDYQELRMMLPETITSTGYGACKPAAQKMLLAAQGARLDAKRKLIEKLRGVMVSGSTRLQDFVVQEHEVVVTIQNTWLIGVQIANEEVIGDSIVRSTISMSRPNFIYSIRLGLEKVGQKMSPEEYQILRNMLSEETYTMAGEAVIE